MRRVRGFTLLETIVALVIFSSAILALYGLLNGSLANLGRVRDVSQQLLAVKQAVEILSVYNFQEDAEGDLNVNQFDVHWTAQRLESLRQMQNARGYTGLYEVGLYSVKLQVSRSGKGYPEYEFRAVGYKRVRGGK